MLLHSTLNTPVGPFTVVVAQSGAVRAAGFTTDVAELLKLVHPVLLEPARPGDPGAVGPAVRAYLDGDLTAIDAVDVEQHTAGAFMSHAWAVMRDIKPGAPVTYTGFAELSGRPAAIRAAAAACARNPVALFTPCHRVMRTDGSLGGYRWGLHVKEWLLKHESAA
ncbi:methylated-DNA--[protein]-cysteine S-methyltransferase [Actinoplanes sichuanensis]|uniref:Methylated-DNA--[protein]-cysteine S-methyltransferase n=1 Tax=Actinoplanes sichuanensis TaxID=512349 RepID=A0ABW4ATB2_9ACTN|nr:methylated-DNA--[protein]-cysteine S-methyltransferase [Actinoplanes sichuanensis]BEL11383.1 methylated-DNA--[protein]-cysteine S-methyltransferase [Actinoplanes sichuanensis]